MNANITVLKDESLGGNMREYREVKRKARVGDLVKVTQVNGIGRKALVGSIGKCTRNNQFSDGSIDTTLTHDEDGFLDTVHETYVVLEPTDILRINGERLRVVDRKAAVGERVIVTGEKATFRIGDVFVVENDDWAYPAAGLRNGRNALDGHYLVLEPVESAKPAPSLSDQSAPDQAAEIIAKLATRVTALEQRLAALESGEPKPMTFAEVNADLARLAQEIREPHPNCGKVVFSRPATYDAPSYLSDQQRRDAIVERAKADVTTLQSSRIRNVPVNGDTDRLAVFNLHPKEDYVRFEVNVTKRSVKALLVTANDTVWARGIAKCAPGDVFNSHIGRAIALRRALGLEVPAEYLSAPNPTEVRVGDVVDEHGYAERRGMEVSAVKPDGYDMADKGLTFKGGGWTYIKACKVIDDSRESNSAEPRKEVA
ncbi:hypothetical protein MKY59_21495 [Paenibacillus sp. FSL W8-0426]|uniref:hypothetical protein n=1 Tax=Paenibacillus sp. FSL W8-0426 TaxID=2921714 RepID=UPI0030D72E2E